MDEALDDRLISILILTSPGRFPERIPLLRRTVARALGQTLQDDQQLEVLVLDDGPDGHAWPAVAVALPNSSENRRLRYVALPPGENGRVNMRLKRNVGLHLSGGGVVVFFDDDDWRSCDSVQAQLELLRRTGADVATVQVQHVCELGGVAHGDVRPSCVRYFATEDGGGLFSTRLGNPGTMMLRRRAWERNCELGFPDTGVEDVDFVRLLTADCPLLAQAGEPLIARLRLVTARRGRPCSA